MGLIDKSGRLVGVYIALDLDVIQDKESRSLLEKFCF